MFYFKRFKYRDSNFFCEVKYVFGDDIARFRFSNKKLQICAKKEKKDDSEKKKIIHSIFKCDVSKKSETATAPDLAPPSSSRLECLVPPLTPSNLPPGRLVSTLGVKCGGGVGIANGCRGDRRVGTRNGPISRGHGLSSPPPHSSPSGLFGPRIGSPVPTSVSSSPSALPAVRPLFSLSK